MTSHDLARVLLSKAAEDLKAFELLASNTGIADEPVGFHAQRAVEKALKAVLTSAGVRYGRTHALDPLIALLGEARIDAPEWLGDVTAFGPYAVLGRYAELDPDEPIDRPAAIALVRRVIDWASERVGEYGST